MVECTRELLMQQGSVGIRWMDGVVEVDVGGEMVCRKNEQK